MRLARSACISALSLSPGAGRISVLSRSNASASSRIGRPCGRNVAMRQLGVSSAPRSCSSCGTRPARTSDDLPQPERPTTAISRLTFSFSRSARVCASRPKKNASSPRSKGRKPG